MASKFRNLIASKIRHQRAARAGPGAGLESLRDLEAQMKLEKSPNPLNPFRITRPMGAANDIIENFDTDYFVPSVLTVHSTNQTFLGTRPTLRFHSEM